ncbi:MAG: helix-turn-helix domain-containing protein [Thermomicrobiales bacterium]
MADLQQTMGKVIRRGRHERSLTLKALAAEAGLSVVYLGEIERGKKYPSAPTLERLAVALHLELSDLLELVADELRADMHPMMTDAIGFALPARGDVVPRVTIKRIVQMLEPEEVTTMAELGAFFLARQRGEKKND